MRSQPPRRHRQSRCAWTPDHACDSGLRSPKAHTHNCCAYRVLVQAPAMNGAGCWCRLLQPLPCWCTTAQALVRLLLRSWCARAELQAFRVSAHPTIPLCVLEAAERAHERQRSWHWMGAALGVLRRSSRPAWHGLSTVWNYKEPACSALARSFTPASSVTTAGHFCVRCLATPSSGTAQRKIRTHMAKQSIGIMRSELCAADSSTAQFTFEEEHRVSV